MNKSMGKILHRGNTKCANLHCAERTISRFDWGTPKELQVLRQHIHPTFPHYFLYWPMNTAGGRGRL